MGKMVIIRRPRLPQLVSITHLTYLSRSGPHLQLFQNALNEALTSYRYALAPLWLSRTTIVVHGFLNPFSMTFSKLRIRFKATTRNKPFAIDQNVSLRWILDLIITAVLPRRRVLHHAISDHIKCNVHQTSRPPKTSRETPIFLDTSTAKLTGRCRRP